MINVDDEMRVYSERIHDEIVRCIMYTWCQCNTRVVSRQCGTRMKKVRHGISIRA